MKHIRCDVCGKEIEEIDAFPFTASYIAGKVFQIEADLCSTHLDEVIKMLRDKFGVDWEKVEE